MQIFKTYLMKIFEIKKIDKKGVFQLQQLIPAAIILIVIAIVLAFGALTLSKVQDQMTINSTEYNATASGLEGLDTAADFQPTLAIVVIAAIIIGVLIAAFAGFLVARR